MASVISLNGKITRGNDPDNRAWSSPEDWQHFSSLRDIRDVIILDRKTYEIVQPQPEAGRLRLVFTSTPEKFSGASVPDQLEFTDSAPTDVLDSLALRGYKLVLLAGGARLSGDFLAAGLVDDIYLTFEPVIFGSGRPLLEAPGLDIELRLESVRQLNASGTVLAHYTLIKSD